MVFTDPKNYTDKGVVLVKDTGDNYQALGNRIVETPRVPVDQDVWRDPHSGFMAYVPVGSVDKVRLQRVVDVMRRFLAFPTFDIGSMLKGRG